MGGIFAKIATAFGYILDFIYNYVNNYGVAIILFTILLKVVLLPFSIRQQKTMKKTTKVQQEVKEIQEKYKNDPTKMNTEIYDLYKRENMSPLGGCLPSLLQFFVILSIFYLVSRPLTYMRHVDSELINNYQTQIQDEREKETGNRNVNYIEIAVIKKFGESDEKVRLNMNFLGLDLSDIPNQNMTNPKVYIIPAFYIATSFLMMKVTKQMTEAMNAKKKEEDEANVIKRKPLNNEEGEDKVEEEDVEDTMASMNKTMRLMMPVMTISIAYIAPLGLTLYWATSNLLNLGERMIINKVVKEEE